MRAVEYFPLAIRKKNDEIWLILQGGIVIPADCVFEDKMALAPGAKFGVTFLCINYYCWRF